MIRYSEVVKFDDMHERGSVEVMRAHVDGLVGERLQAFGGEVDYSILILERPFDQQKPRTRDNKPFLSKRSGVKGGAKPVNRTATGGGEKFSSGAFRWKRPGNRV